jgi:hypothetical protein
MSACCCIDVDDPAEICDKREIKRARKPHECCECLRVIPAGAPYRYEAALHGGSWSHWKTCALCASVRDDRFGCGFYWGNLWELLRDCLDEACSCEDECDCDSWLDPPTRPIEVR